MNSLAIGKVPPSMRGKREQDEEIGLQPAVGLLPLSAEQLGYEGEGMTGQPIYPEAVFIQRADRRGFGFFFLSGEDFTHAADSFLRPIGDVIAQKAAAGADRRALRLAAARNFLAQIFDGTLEEVFAADSIRWVAAACLRETFTAPGSMPRVAVIDRSDGQVTVRPGSEYHDHPGWPRAVVIGRKREGGGPAWFFDSEDQYDGLGQTAPSRENWLVPIIWRLYARTPSVMTGAPKSDGDGGKVGIECAGLGFGAQIPLVERSAT